MSVGKVLSRLLLFLKFIQNHQKVNTIQIMIKI